MESPFTKENYTAESPTLGKKIKFNKDEIFNEFQRIADEAGGTRWSVGQSLYYQSPLFCDIGKFVDKDSQDMIGEYTVCKQFHVPAASTLDEMEWDRFQGFQVIEEEMISCQKREMELKRG